MCYSAHCTRTRTALSATHDMLAMLCNAMQWQYLLAIHEITNNEFTSQLSLTEKRIAFLFEYYPMFSNVWVFYENIVKVM